MKKVDTMGKFRDAIERDKSLCAKLEDFQLQEKTNWTEPEINLDKIDFEKEYYRLKKENQALKKKIEMLEKHILAK